MVGHGGVHNGLIDEPLPAPSSRIAAMCPPPVSVVRRIAPLPSSYALRPDHLIRRQRSACWIGTALLTLDDGELEGLDAADHHRVLTVLAAQAARYRREEGIDPTEARIGCAFGQELLQAIDRFVEVFATLVN